MSALLTNPRTDRVGRMGVERQYEAVLEAHPGVAVEQNDRSGHVVTSYRRLEPVAGQDVELTLDVALQRTAEDLLRSALERRSLAKRGQNYFPEKNSSDPFLPAGEAGGGAVVVMDVHERGDSRRRLGPRVRSQPVRSRQQRATRRLDVRPVNAAFRPRQAAWRFRPARRSRRSRPWRCWSRRTIGPQTSFFCQGYLHQPDRQRCEIYVRQGVGHGEVTLGRRPGTELQRLLLPFRRVDGAAAAGRLGRTIWFRPADGRGPARRGRRHASLPGEHPRLGTPYVANQPTRNRCPSAKAR